MFVLGISLIIILFGTISYEQSKNDPVTKQASAMALVMPLLRIGSHHKCFYNPERVTDVIMELPSGPSDLTIAYVFFGIGFGMFVLAVVLYVGACIKEKKKENLNDSSQHTPMELKAFTSSDKKENTNEITYVNNKTINHA
ncbi:unnamed protein product [Adineta steineri]|uniref:Uncharacterized protein n=1 Tax=Adineta steineri TaxID=433720 RepID=A0A818WHX6_9BILA|nr:unnamed protein product [Adineta steineri]CAF3724218.1 unnamed protein product [Adineta steineri]